MRPKKTKVEKYGMFWCVYVLMHGVWARMRDLYLTRARARKGRAYWTNY